jgi:hypothetical protein
MKTTDTAMSNRVEVLSEVRQLNLDAPASRIRDMFAEVMEKLTDGKTNLKEILNALEPLQEKIIRVDSIDGLVPDGPEVGFKMSVDKLTQIAAVDQLRKVFDAGFESDEATDETPVDIILRNYQDNLEIFSSNGRSFLRLTDDKLMNGILTGGACITNPGEFGTALNVAGKIEELLLTGIELEIAK